MMENLSARPVTSLPGSPADGDMATLVDSLTTPTYVWRFIYSAGVSANKWLFLGGSPAYAEVVTGETTSSVTYAALATAGPSIALPNAGDYDIEIGFTLFNSSAGNSVYMSYDIGGTGAVDADSVTANGTDPVDENAVMRRRRKTGLTAVTLTSKYRIGSGGPYTFEKRWMSVLPVKVS